MTTYFIDSSVADDTGDGLSWATAKKTFGAGLALATAAGDIVKVHYQHTEVIAATKTYNLANHIAVLSVDKNNADTLTQMDGATYSIGGGAAYGINFGGAYKGFFWGLAIRCNQDIYLSKTDGAHQEFENCRFWFGTASNFRLRAGDGASQNGYVRLKNCGFKFGNTTQSLSALGSHVKLEGCYLETGTTVPAFLWGDVTAYVTRATIKHEACDFSLLSTIILSGTITGHAEFEFANCRFHASVTRLSSLSPLNQSSVEAWFYNSQFGDTLSLLEHHNALGSTTVSADVYANDGKTYDGTNRCSWKVASTAYATFWAPYVSPWLDRAFIPASTPVAIDPYFECLRDGSATAFQNDEVWPEMSYQGTSGSVLASFASGRKGLVSTAADLTASSKTASDWTGENATAWFGKLTLSGSITPQEPGHIRTRFCIGEPSTTLYVDPQLRGV